MTVAGVIKAFPHLRVRGDLFILEENENVLFNLGIESSVPVQRALRLRGNVGNKGPAPTPGDGRRLVWFTSSCLNLQVVSFSSKL